MIYILEDDAGIQKLIMYTLAKEGMENRGFDKPSDFYDALDKTIPNLILLDIMLPQEDGLSILKKLKNDVRYKDIPVIMITAKSSEYDKVLGLDEGADDYVAKPFGIMELVARVNAVLRRTKNNRKSDDFHYRDLYVSQSQRVVKVKGENINLTKKEFDILVLLLSRPGICFTRDEIINQVWGYEFEDSSRTVDVHIRTLRFKLKDAGEYIETVRGVGYKMGEIKNDK